MNFIKKLANKDGTGNALQGIVSVLFVAVCFAPMVALGILSPNLILMALAGAGGGCAMAWGLTSGEVSNFAGWGGIGLVAGIAFYYLV
jgi:hypothetical protein